MKDNIIKFDNTLFQIMDSDGSVDKKLMPKISESEIKKIYEYMVLTRAFDEKAINLQRQGRIGTYASVRGQEAAQIASAIQLKDDDLVFPAFREHGVFITRDIPIDKLFQFWAGDERGMYVTKMNVVPAAITVGGHLPHAVGAAMGFKYFKTKKVAVAYFGDGATSEGDFHEALNFAGVFKSPVIFMCQNNQWAISTPVSEQSASQTLAQKAIAYGINGIRIDGNDVFAVYSAFKDALERARSGKGPTLIECLTYRLGDHTTSDDAKKYRDEKEVKQWEKKEPLLRLQLYMKKNKLLNSTYEQKTKENAVKAVNDGFAKYEKTPLADAEEIFNYTYSSLTQELKEQLAQFSAGDK